MNNPVYDFQSHNSPWTEVYDMHCSREDAAADMTETDKTAEQQPTHDALADVYNRESGDTTSKRF